MAKNKRIASIDSWRAIAIGAVIILHLYSVIQIDLTWYAVVLHQWAQVAVPIFFLLIGYFFGKKMIRAKTPGQALYKYIQRLFILFIFWKLFYIFFPNHLSAVLEFGLSVAWLAQLKDGFAYFLSDPLIYLVNGPQGRHLWFLFVAIIDLMLLAALIRFGLKKLLLPLAIGLYLLGLVLTSYGVFLGMSVADYQVPMGYFFAFIFLVLGYQASQKRFKPRAASAIFFIISGAVLIIIEGQIFFLFSRFHPINIYFYIGTILLAWGIFTIALSNKEFGKNIYLDKIGSYAAGIYVLHAIVIFYLSELLAWDGLKGKIMLFICTYVLSFLFAYLLSKIKIMKRLVM